MRLVEEDISIRGQKWALNGGDSTFHNNEVCVLSLVMARKLKRRQGMQLLAQQVA